MKWWLLVSMTAFIICILYDPAHADRLVRGGYANAAGGVTAGGAHDLRGPFGGRSVGESGAVTNGQGGGVAGRRGCARDGAGAQGCRASATAWDRYGNFVHEGSAIFEGPLGGYGSATGSVTRDSSGAVSGSRSGEYNVGNRTYNAQTSVATGQGVQRSVTCSGAGCP